MRKFDFLPFFYLFSKKSTCSTKRGKGKQRKEGKEQTPELKKSDESLEVKEGKEVRTLVNGQLSNFEVRKLFFLILHSLALSSQINRSIRK
jgi:hypothetical protein